MEKHKRLQCFLIFMGVVILILTVGVITLAVLLATKKTANAELYTSTDISSIIYTSTTTKTTTRTTSTANPQKPTKTPAPMPRKSDSPMNTYEKFAVAADNGICSSLGRQILRNGGNAVDAAITVDLCIGVTDPHSAGIGGGFFMTVYNATTKSCTVIDAREMAPGAATETMYVLQPNTSQKGYLSIGVPGDLHGLRTAHELFGFLPWKELFAPVVELARDGHPVSGSLASAISGEAEFILAEATLNSTFVNMETGLPFVAGEIIKYPELANLLEFLGNSSDPIHDFYSGSIAETIVKDITVGGGGIITLEDMRNYSAKVRSPLVTHLDSVGLTVCGPPPPSGAAIAMAILNILNGYNMSRRNLETFDDAVTTFHRIIEAQKFAYAQRSYLGDMDFVPNATAVAEEVVTKDWGEFVRQHITDLAHDTDYYGGRYTYFQEHGTSQMSVLDERGNAVSVTSTINLHFGSQRRSPSLGIIYNDEMDDFSTPNTSNAYGYRPSPANYIKPFKRPQSSMSPIVVFNTTSGAVRLIVGASGGSTIISGTAYVATHNLFLGHSIKESVDYPRLHNQLWPNTTTVEDGFSREYLKALEQKGQTFDVEGTVGSVSSGVERVGSKLRANSDYRKVGGFPAGL